MKVVGVGQVWRNAGPERESGQFHVHFQKSYLLSYIIESSLAVGRIQLQTVKMLLLVYVMASLQESNNAEQN